MGVLEGRHCPEDGGHMGAPRQSAHVRSRTCASHAKHSTAHSGALAHTPSRFPLAFWVQFSTDSLGYCGDGTDPAPEGCTWSVQKIVKVVNKSCSDNAIYTAIEQAAANASRRESCFAQCDDSGVGRKRNTSSTCWISCFYDTLIGEGAGSKVVVRGGMSAEGIRSLWSLPFARGAGAGGCDPIE